MESIPPLGWNFVGPIITGFLAIVLLRYIVRRLTDKSKGPKPPQVAGGLPLIGHLSLLGGPELPHVKLGNLADKYGPIFSIRLGIHSAVVINSWEVAKECFTTHDVAVSSRPKLIGSKLLGYNYAMFGFGPYGSYWRQLRKILTLELLSNRRLELLKGVWVSEMEGGIKELYKLWDEKNDGQGMGQGQGQGHDQVSVEMKRWLGDLNMNLILGIVTGKRYFGKTAVVEEKEARRCQKALREFLYLIGLFPLGDAVPYLGWLDVGGHVKAMKRVSKELDAILTEWLEDHKKNRAANSKFSKQEKDFMDVMLSIFEEPSNIPTDPDTNQIYDADTIIKATCLSAVLGGSDTIVVAVIWALSLLLNNRHALEKVKQELDTQIGRERKLNESDVKQLIYLQAVVKESMRLYGAGSLTVRETLEDFKVNGFQIPKGTWMFVNMWKIQTDERVWPEPLEFKPERFMTTQKDVDVRGQHFELIPFGGGRRACPGLSFGLQIVPFMLASLLHAFDITTPGDAAVDMTGTIGLTNMKATPLDVLIKPRLASSLYV